MDDGFPNASQEAEEDPEEGNPNSNPQVENSPSYPITPPPSFTSAVEGNKRKAPDESEYDSDEPPPYPEREAKRRRINWKTLDEGSKDYRLDIVALMGNTMSRPLPSDDMNIIRQLFGLQLDDHQPRTLPSIPEDKPTNTVSSAAHSSHTISNPHPNCPYCKLAQEVTGPNSSPSNRYKLAFKDHHHYQQNPSAPNHQHVHGKICNELNNVGLVVDHQIIPGGRVFIPQIPRGLLATRNYLRNADPRIEKYASALLEDMDREDPINATKLRNFLNRNRKGPKVKNLFESRKTDSAFWSPVRPQPPANFVRRINADNFVTTLGPYMQFSTNISLDRQKALSRVRKPADFIPPSAKISLQIEHNFPFDIEDANPDLWTRVTCVFLYKYVEKFVYGRGFYAWAEKYAWFKNTTAKTLSFRYFDPLKAELNLSQSTNIYLFPPEREFLHLALDFLTKAFFCIPGSDTFDVLSIVIHLLSDVFIDKSRANEIVWKRLTGEFGNLGEYPAYEMPGRVTPPPSSPSASTSSSSSTGFFEYWTADDDIVSTDSY